MKKKWEVYMLISTCRRYINSNKSYTFGTFTFVTSDVLDTKAACAARVTRTLQDLVLAYIPLEAFGAATRPIPARAAIATAEPSVTKGTFRISLVWCDITDRTILARPSLHALHGIIVAVVVAVAGIKWCTRGCLYTPSLITWVLDELSVLSQNVTTRCGCHGCIGCCCCCDNGDRRRSVLIG